MMRRPNAFLLGCFMLAMALPACVHADDAIRVLLAQDAPRIQISAERRLSVQWNGSQERTFSDSVTIAALPDGTMSLNCEALAVGTAVTVSGGEGVTVRVGQGGESYAPPLVVSGALRVQRGKGQGGLAVVNHVDVEEYVRGVVPAEMNAAWHPEALKVQAVVSRTYALYQRQATLSLPALNPQGPAHNKRRRIGFAALPYPHRHPFASRHRHSGS
ncbi:MAG: SpoIID/LytB domain-containing protein, partial [Nitrospiraceae bacterium]